MSNPQANEEELSIGGFIVIGSVIGTFWYVFLGKFLFLLLVAIIIIVIVGVIYTVPGATSGKMETLEKDRTRPRAEYMEANQIVTLRDGRKIVVGRRTYRL